MQIGEYLVSIGLVTAEQVEAALDQQRQTGGRLGEILQTVAGIRSLSYYEAISSYFNIEFVDLTKLHPDKKLLNEKDRPMYAAELVIPVALDNGRVTVATADPSEKTFQRIRALWGDNAKIVATAKFDIFFTLQQVFSHNYSHEIVSELFEKDASKSAMETFTRSQQFAVTLMLAIFLLILYISYPLGMIIFNAFLTISVSIVLIYKFILSAIGFGIPIAREKEQSQIDGQELPIYTILVPMLWEKRVTIEHLAKNLTLMDYPSHKLDIKLVCESDDLETIQIIKDLRLPSYFEIVRVPVSKPRTKPKACNYALKFARGEFVTIYDAEDRPDPDQLKKALKTFMEGDKQLACVQCALNYFNRTENWLTRMFTIEYTYWFDLLLPALSRLKLPIPLGGTSNHFRTEFLREMIAWDPFNVTEDADLGMRMSRLKYRSRAVTSTTYEEANCRLMNWIRQRSRWMKGYMQTYLVHMRNPIKLFRELGPKGFLSFQLFIGGTVFSNLANMILLVIFILSIVLGYEKLKVLFPSPTLEIAWLNFIVGNLVLLLLNFLAILRRRMYSLLPFVLTAPIYWFLAGIASYRALYQLLFNPSYWEKTEHGISKVFVNPAINEGHKK